MLKQICSIFFVAMLAILMAGCRHHQPIAKTTPPPPPVQPAPAVDADAQFLAAHPDWHLTIEGHCDERGSEDYNMALGQNRARQVMDALVREGVSASAVKLISLGKERPFCSSANNEACWSQNRRAHFVLQKKERASMN